MKVYCGAMLHATNKQSVAPGQLGQAVSLDLGDIPEEVVTKEIAPIINQLTEVLNKYKIYAWITTGYRENTDNEV